MTLNNLTTGTTQAKDDPKAAAHRKLARPLLLTRTGIVLERMARAFWPFWTVILTCLAALLLGLHESIGAGGTWVVIAVAALALGSTLYLGVWRFRWPGKDEARDRLDRTLPGRPIAALEDTQAIGAGDSASTQVWKAHVARMASRAAAARPVVPDLRLSSRDRFGLRFAALTLFVTAVAFGSIWRAATITDIGPGSASALAGGPSWEGWVEPPAYTGLPSLYLNDLDRETLEVIKGTRITVRLYGEVGALRVDESISGMESETAATAENPAQEFAAFQSGTLEVSGPGGQAWDIVVLPDALPKVELTGAADRAVDGE
ncbi:MAG: DUF4175 family protein, partial [Pseudomonadota bacterium]